MILGAKVASSGTHDAYVSCLSWRLTPSWYSCSCAVILRSCAVKPAISTLSRHQQPGSAMALQSLAARLLSSIRHGRWQSTQHRAGGGITSFGRQPRCWVDLEHDGAVGHHAGGARVDDGRKGALALQRTLQLPLGLLDPLLHARSMVRLSEGADGTMLSQSLSDCLHDCSPGRPIAGGQDMAEERKVMLSTQAMESISTALSAVQAVPSAGAVAFTGW